jgi:hypothetical protein
MRRRIIWVLAIVAMLAAFAPATAAVADDPDEDEDELHGVIESLPGTPGFVGDWIVSGTTVHVTADTEIEQEDGQVAVGATVEVKGTTAADGSITADKIEVSEAEDDDEFGEIELEGFVQALPATPDLVGDWTVSGLTVHVTTATEIEQEDGTIVVGSAVEVEGLLESDGSVTARKIETEDAEDVDEDSMTLTGTATVVPRTDDHSGMWRVSTHAVRVRHTTAIVHERRLSRGSTVRVFGTFRANGSMLASRIVVKS